AANGQTHPHAIALGSEERIENPVGKLNPVTVVPDLCLDRGLGPPHAHGKNPVIGHSVHGLHAIADQLHQNLFDLHAVQGDLGKVSVDSDIDLDPATRRLFGHQIAGLDHQVPDRSVYPHVHG